MRGFEDGPDLHGERLAAFVAIVEAEAGRFALHHTERWIDVAAMRADPAIRPKPSLDEGEGGLLIVEVEV